MSAVVDTTGSTPVGVHPVLAALALVEAALSGAAADSCWSLSDAELVAALGAALSVRSGTEAVTASLVGQAETRGVRSQLQQASTAGWLRRRFQLSSREANRLTGLAEVLPRCGVHPCGWTRVTLPGRQCVVLRSRTGLG